MAYQVGVLTEPKSTDELFDDLLDAREAAIEMANKDANWPVAVWRMPESEVECLFLAGQEFRLA